MQRGVLFLGLAVTVVATILIGSPALARKPTTTTFTTATTSPTTTASTMAITSTTSTNATTTTVATSCSIDEECDDGAFCNGEERCSLGECIPGEPPDVADPFDCTIDRCDEEEQRVVHEPDAAFCVDDNECTDDACDIEAGCLNTPNQNTCDDGVECTIDDRCEAGKCAGVSGCDEGEVCELDTGSCIPGQEGDVNSDGMITAADALSALRVAVGATSCELEICDLDHSGAITAADALLILVAAVGIS